MKLKEIMSKNPETIEPNATLQTAAQTMKRSNVGILPVVEQDKLIGVLTDRDIVVRALCDGGAAKSVRDVMTKNPVTLRHDEDASQAFKTMSERKIGRLMVVNEGGKLAGVISAHDLAATGDSAQKVQDLACTLGEAHRKQPTGTTARV